MSKQTLSEAIRLAARQRGMSFSKIAGELRISPDSLRTWIARNRYPEPEAIQIAEHLKLGGATEVKSKYSFQTTTLTKRTTPKAKQRRIFATAETLLDAMNALDERIEIAYRTQEEFGEDVLQLFRVMGKGDVFVYCSLDEIPFEMHVSGFNKVKNALRKAIGDGAHFVYLYPGQKLLELLHPSGIRLPYPNEFAAKFKKYVQDLAFGNELLNVSEYVHMHLIECPVFMSPQHKYVLLRPAQDPSRYRVYARFPTGNRGMDLGLHVPLVTSASEQFAQFVQYCVANEDKLKTLLN